MGIAASVPLFFKSSGDVDYATLEGYLARLGDNESLSAIYSMTYNTRYSQLSDTEVLAVNKFIISCCRDYGFPIYVGHPLVFDKSRLRNYLFEVSELNPSGISMLYPERFFGNEKVIIDFLKMPQDFGLPTVFHEMKMVSGFDGSLIDWPASLLERIFDEVELIAVKEDSKNDEVTRLILDKCRAHDVECILAGGGKQRAQAFFRRGLKTWLNGSTVLFPDQICDVGSRFTDGDEAFIKAYLSKVEKPFFDKCVSQYGWHLAHKAGLEYFGYGSRYERFPHPSLSDAEFVKICPVFEEMAGFF